jgi:uncharacterized membrane protein YvbJ
VTCPDCGARNTVDAPWCTQCLRPLGDVATTASTDTAATATRAPTPGPPPRPAAPATDEDRAVRSVDGRVEWRCPRCRTWNALEVAGCAACGQPLGEAVVGSSARHRSEQVARMRQWLWVAAAVVGGVVVVGVLLVVLAALGSGAA